MSARITLGELLELADEVASPAQKRAARGALQRVRHASKSLQRDMGLLGELDQTLQRASAVRYEETAPGVFTSRRPRLAEMVREVRTWRRSR